ncbi:hypothetical protein [Streptomyces sp. NPDC001774]
MNLHHSLSCDEQQPAVYVDTYGITGDGRPRYLAFLVPRPFGGPAEMATCDPGAIREFAVAMSVPPGLICYSEDARAALCADTSQV